MKHIPKEHQDLVLDRIEKIEKNPERPLDWDEASKMFESDQNKKKFERFFGTIKLSEDAVTLQRRWRDEG
jgi:hypothetical protein